MTTILIAVLFFLQLLTFYFLIILNTKLAKFKDLEKKQERLMSEMDDTISVYLTEMKDENDRLIKELQNVSPSELAATSVQQTVSYEPQQEQAYSAAEQELKKDRPLSLDKDARLYVPKNIVANAYSRQRQTTETIASSPMPLKVEQKEEVKELTMEQQALNLAKQGKSTEEIAKQLQKGKTEIELLLKFHH
ncbi:hypothetical protein ACE1MS_05015 [Lysinibacillus sp. fkY74-1]|uniref:Swarming motility protein SwrB n=4 Tax=Lysinibacillus TaxID=400634 RepID=W7S8T1_LYSSH|nr:MULTISPECIES: hypothetical protein [Lysinibacillus]MBE5085165.1 hypothetical protein [Bacillus thuringiensis]AMO34609.1 hypothetical protein AR327_20350 [Lysinibacillus sphaericus]AMR90276.1 hypothetical protein A1T07_08860 [Lysinibacillus sphaericus]ANA44326.1 hypothetical protein A2J09_01530 [Lysinibacillus sphaericus]EWH34646.1 hypothetical protein P799_03575 [Lysinibacillus sphaericus CBAM5]